MPKQLALMVSVEAHLEPAPLLPISFIIRSIVNEIIMTISVLMSSLTNMSKK